MMIGRRSFPRTPIVVLHASLFTICPNPVSENESLAEPDRFPDVKVNLPASLSGGDIIGRTFRIIIK
jgi:hypothetical protein